MSINLCQSNPFIWTVVSKVKSSWVFWGKWLSLSYIERPPLGTMATAKDLLPFQDYWDLPAICKFCKKRNYELQIAALDNHYLIFIFIVVITVFWNFLSKFCSIFLQLGIACHCCLLYVCSATEDQERRERGQRVGGGEGGLHLLEVRPPELIHV